MSAIPLIAVAFIRSSRVHFSHIPSPKKTRTCRWQELTWFTTSALTKGKRVLKRWNLNEVLQHFKGLVFVQRYRRFRPRGRIKNFFAKDPAAE